MYLVAGIKQHMSILMKRLTWEENENGISLFTTNSINIQSLFLS